LDGLFKGLGQDIGGVEHTSVIDIGNIHREHIAFKLGLRCFNSNPALSGNST